MIAMALGVAEQVVFARSDFDKQRQRRWGQTESLECSPGRQSEWICKRSCATAQDRERLGTAVAAAVIPWPDRLRSPRSAKLVPTYMTTDMSRPCVLAWYNEKSASSPANTLTAMG